MTFNDIRIGTKIALAVSFVGIVGFLAAMVVSFELAETGHLYNGIIASAPPGIHATGQAGRRVNDMMAQTYKVIAYPGGSKEEVDATAKMAESYKTALVRLETAATKLPQRKAEIERLVGQVHDIKKLLDGAIELGRRDQNADALKIMDKADRQTSELTEACVSLASEILNELDRTAATTSNSIDRTIKMMAGLSLAGILLGIGMALLMSSRTISRPLARLRGAMDRLAAGDFDTPVEGSQRRDEVGQMAGTVLVFKQNGLEMRRLEAQAAEQERIAEAERQSNEQERRRVEVEREALAREQQQVVSLLANGLDLLAQGDLTYRIDDQVAADYQKLRDDFNRAVNRLSETVTTIQSTSVDVANAAREINSGADDLSKRTEEQASSLEESAATTEQLAASVKASAQSSRQAVQLADDAMRVAERGGAIVTDAVAAMSRIEQASKKISDITSVIDEIAFQTNLLALNAAVEAARAGDAGKGFAVVASEVRTLAQRSSEAAKDITALISASGSEVEQGVSLVRSAGEALGQIVEASKKVSSTVSDISSASSEQANGIEEMSQTVAHMDEMTQQNAALAEESAASASSLAGQIDRLNGLVGAFRTGQRRQAGPVVEPARERLRA